MTLLRINHVQLAIPRGQDEQARRFYRDVLGLQEIPKPPELAAGGGAWFELGGAELHLGVDPEFRPAKKAHVAFEAEDLDRVASRCESAGHPPRFDERIRAQRRFFVDDPFGNRLEVLQAPGAQRPGVA